MADDTKGGKNKAFDSLSSLVFLGICGLAF